MTIPHDPAHLAHLTFRWRDKHWHLIEEPEPVVVLVSDHLSKGDRHPTKESAETAFWVPVTDALLSHPERLASAKWPDTELAVVSDHDDHVHLAEKTHRSGSSPTCQAWTLADAETGVTAFLNRLRLLTGAPPSDEAIHPTNP
ncbi:hypothetical protein [Streptosporangium carneum]|uniref:Uncharacterized protein n=1 Tax=Streptosporangium carneum TaxID=47481 RepID=A0A9W6HVT4_9ACTN|nr:hypothetical protein [Streptosporangium carneum]GLK06629.1 hypothetical protein GCM10017600_00340 [Streptosporangium carneum]